MERNWTFGQKVAGGFCVSAALTLLVCAVSVIAMKSTVAQKDFVIEVNAMNLKDAALLESATDLNTAGFRGYLLTGEDRYLDTMHEASEASRGILQNLNNRAYTAEGRRALTEIEQALGSWEEAQSETVAMRRSGAEMPRIVSQFTANVAPKRELIKNRNRSFVEAEQRLLDDGMRSSNRAASSAIGLLLAISAGALIASVVLTVVLTRVLTRQISSAIRRVESSSTELQAAANQQASGSREQASATTEVSTTIKELLSTSRQIAESTQRVSRMMEESAQTARSAGQIVHLGSEAIGTIRRQVDAIVMNMLGLGKKSQQIGSILEIINEMAEQTNILAINATIEAAGAGEAGKRFSVVADEIRNLADRVGKSTKEIRTLIEETKAAANTTVMATEDGSKAVESGSKQFAEVAAAFDQIKSLMETTMEAAKEIELGTRQQATAVEQVTVAMSNVAQAAKETEVTARQTLDTSSELASLSKDLARLIQAGAGA